METEYVYQDTDKEVLEKIELKGFQYHFIYDGDNQIYNTYSTDIIHEQDIPEYDFNNGDILVRYSEEKNLEERKTGYIRWSEEEKKWLLTGRQSLWLWNGENYELIFIDEFDEDGDSGFREPQVEIRWDEDEAEYLLVGKQSYWLGEGYSQKLIPTDKFDEDDYSDWGEPEDFDEKIMEDIVDFDLPNLWKHLPETHKQKHPFVNLKPE